MGVRIRVPASTANLGPGYDSFGLALGLHNEFEAELAAEWSVEVGGEGASHLERGPENPVLRAMARVFAEAGSPELRAELTCHNGIPLGVGLGSSAAAIIGGVVLGDALSHAGLTRQRMLEIADEIEGHPDNVAAALLGGFTVCSRTGSRLTCAQTDPAGGLAAVLVLGEHPLATDDARHALPHEVDHAAAARNTARASLLALGIALGDEEWIAAGMHDEIHEDFRATLVPDMSAVRSLFEAAGVGPAVLSGAGPTMLALVGAQDDELALDRARVAADLVRPLLAEVGRTRVLAVGVDRFGTRMA